MSTRGYRGAESRDQMGPPPVTGSASAGPTPNGVHLHERSEARTLAELADSGMLWLFNRAVLHPRGFALGLVTDDAGAVLGWQMHGDGSEVCGFTPATDDEKFEAVARTLAQAAIDNRPIPGES